MQKRGKGQISTLQKLVDLQKPSKAVDGQTRSPVDHKRSLPSYIPTSALTMPYFKNYKQLKQDSHSNNQLKFNNRIADNFSDVHLCFLHFTDYAAYIYIYINFYVPCI